MRSVIYGALITTFLASAGTVQAANELDGKALLCISGNSTHPHCGLVFDKGDKRIMSKLMNRRIGKMHR